MKIERKCELRYQEKEERGEKELKEARGEKGAKKGRMRRESRGIKVGNE